MWFSLGIFLLENFFEIFSLLSGRSLGMLFLNAHVYWISWRVTFFLSYLLSGELAMYSAILIIVVESIAHGEVPMLRPNFVAGISLLPICDMPSGGRWEVTVVISYSSNRRYCRWTSHETCWQCNAREVRDFTPGKLEIIIEFRVQFILRDFDSRIYIDILWGSSATELSVIGRVHVHTISVHILIRCVYGNSCINIYTWFS